MHLTDNRQLSFGFGVFGCIGLICRGYADAFDLFAAAMQMRLICCCDYADAFDLFAPAMQMRLICCRDYADATCLQ